MAGSKTLANALKTTVDGQNISFFDAAQSAGYTKDEGDLSSVFLEKGSYSAFVELHIEQGPILEDEGRPFLTYTFLTLGIISYTDQPCVFWSRYISWHCNSHCSPSKHKSGF